MPLPTTNLSFSQLQTEFGGSNPISLSEYYKGGSYIDGNDIGAFGAPPASGAINLGDFRGAPLTNPPEVRSSAIAQGNSVTMPTHEAGDLIIGFACRSTQNFSITVGGTWGASVSSTTNNVRWAIAYKFASNSSETFGTWTSATVCAAIVIRNANNASGTQFTAGNFSTLVNGNITNVSTTSTVPYELKSAPYATWGNKVLAICMAYCTEFDVDILTPPTGLTAVQTDISTAARVVSFFSNSSFYGSATGMFGPTNVSISVGTTFQGLTICLPIPHTDI